LFFVLTLTLRNSLHRASGLLSPKIGLGIVALEDSGPWW